MKCPKCGSNKYCKNGRSGYGPAEGKKQRFRCYECEYNYTKPLASTGTLKNWGHKEGIRLQALELFHNEPGLSYRAMAARLTYRDRSVKPSVISNVSHGTVRNWIVGHKKSIGEHVPAPKPRKRPAPYTEDDAGHII